MELTSHPSFKPFYRYTFFATIPPYYYNHKFGYLTTFGLFVFFARSIPLLITEQEFFAEMFFMTSAMIQMLLRGILFLYKRKSCDEILYEMDKFIKENEHNPITGEKDYFLNTWKKNFVFKHAKWYTITLMGSVLTWQIPVVYDMATNLENVIYPYYPVYSPYFELNSFTKVAYTLTDLILDWNALFNTVHFEIVSMSILSFLHCQYSYLKELLDGICNENENDSRKIKWWIENHCKIIRFTKMLQELLAPVIVVHYIGLIGSIASCIFALSETSAQSLFQKYLMIIVFSMYLFQLGWNCNTMEKINEINRKMHENMPAYYEREGKFEMDVVFNMINFMSKKPVKLSGPGFFTYTNKEFKNLIMETYSFYSSLVSFKRH